MEEYDIIGITESCIDIINRDSLAEFAIPGYNLFSCERHHRQGGGVLLYAKSSLHPLVISKQTIDNINATYIQLKHHSRKLTIGLIYGPSVQTRETDGKLYEQIAEISCRYDSIIFGDFNLPVTLYPNFQPPRCSGMADYKTYTTYNDGEF